MKRKLIIGLTAAAVSLSLATPAAAAANRRTASTGIGSFNGGRQSGRCGRYFVDADGDGICDNFTGTGQNAYCGRYFVDADGDGICDNFAGTRQGARRGLGRCRR